MHDTELVLCNLRFVGSPDVVVDHVAVVDDGDVAGKHLLSFRRLALVQRVVSQVEIVDEQTECGREVVRNELVDLVVVEDEIDRLQHVLVRSLGTHDERVNDALQTLPHLSVVCQVVCHVRDHAQKTCAELRNQLHERLARELDETVEEREYALIQMERRLHDQSHVVHERRDFIGRNRNGRNPAPQEGRYLGQQEMNARLVE